MIVKNSSRNANLILIFAFCLLIMPCAAGAAIEDHITRTETGFYYTIQKGDTLWDLSRQFSDSPWVWPDLWSHNNPQIKNPHRIYPGQKILIYKKGWTGAEKMALPSQPVIKPAIKKEEPSHGFSEIDRVGFIKPAAVPHHGTIFKSKDDLALIDKGTMVYIYPEPGAPALTVGGQYTLFRTFDRIMSPDTKDIIGVQHLLTGVLEITSVEPEFAIGNVIASYRDILINDRLMPYVQRSDDIPVRPGVTGLSGLVIKPEEEENLIGENAIIFIDKGEKDGVLPGQEYAIFLQESARPNPDEIRQVDLTPLHIGSLMVLHTEDVTSTVIVTNSKQQILSGNLVSAMAGEK
jgi:hypothetical protein